MKSLKVLALLAVVIGGCQTCYNRLSPMSQDAVPEMVSGAVEIFGTIAFVVLIGILVWRK